MKILTKKQQKEILRRITLLEIESILYVKPSALRVFADHLTEISLIVGGTDAMEECVDKAINLLDRRAGVDHDR